MPVAESFTVPELSNRWKVSSETIYIYIDSGQLEAVDVARQRGGRPSYRILRDAVRRFEQRRSTLPKQDQQDTRRSPTAHIRDFV